MNRLGKISIYSILLLSLGITAIFLFSNVPLIHAGTSESDTSNSFFISHNLPDSYLPIQPVPVIITLNFGEKDCGGAYIEYLPEGWTATDITGDGKGLYNDKLNSIIWAPIDGPLCGGNKISELRYNAIPPKDSIGSKLFYGEFSVDGSSVKVENKIGAGSNEQVDNTKSYDPAIQEVTITNDKIDTVPVEVVKARLTTPKVNFVSAGKNVKVAEINMTLLYDYPDLFKSISLYNLKTNQSIGRPMYWKYADVEKRVVNDYEKICSSTIYGGIPVPREECTEKENGTKVIDVESWIDLDMNNLTKKEYKIGLFTDVLPNEKVEWIPKIAGLEIPEWATWTSALSDGLMVYYNFTNYNNSLNSAKYNLVTSAGTPTLVTGKIGTGLNCSAGSVVQTASYPEFNFNSSYSVGYTVSFWQLGYGGSGEKYILSKDDAAASHWYIGYETGLAPRSWGMSATSFRWLSGSVNTTWDLYTVSCNATACVYYTNDLRGVTGTRSNMKNDSTTVLAICDYPAYPNRWNGVIDELAIWNRTLSDAEVVTLWNGGAGVQYPEPSGGGDTSYPLFTNNVTIPATLATYAPNAIYYFNITIDNTNGTVFFEFNNTNYTARNNSNVYYANMTNLRAGTYPYKWIAYGNGTTNLLNVSISRNYVISKAQTTSNFTLLPATSSFYGTPATWTCTNTNLSAILYVGGVDATATQNNVALIRKAASYTVNCTSFSNENYTGDSSEVVYTVKQLNSTITLLLNSAGSNVLTSYGNSVNASAISGFGALTIYRNGTNVTTDNNLAIVLSAGYYNFTAVSSGNENYSAISTSLFANITKADSLLGLGLSGQSPITWGTATIYSGSESNSGDGGCTYSLTPANAVYKAGTVTFNYSTTGCANFTAGSIAATATINKLNGTSNLTLTPSSPITWNASSNFTCFNANGFAANLFVDSINQTTNNGLSITRKAATYNVNCTSDGNENITTSSIATSYLINKASGATSLNFNLVSPQNDSANLNATCSVITGVGVLQLLRNSANVTNEIGTLVNLTIGSYAYNCTIPGDENNSYAENVSTFVVANTTVPSVSHSSGGSSGGGDTRVTFVPVKISQYNANTSNFTNAVMFNGTEFVPYENTEGAKNLLYEILQKVMDNIVLVGSVLWITIVVALVYAVKKKQIQ